jgi:hypothetical protein
VGGAPPTSERVKQRRTSDRRDCRFDRRAELSRGLATTCQALAQYVARGSLSFLVEVAVAKLLSRPNATNEGVISLAASAQGLNAAGKAKFRRRIVCGVCDAPNVGVR